MKYILLALVLVTLGCNGKKKYHDKKEVVVVNSNAVNDIIAFQEGLNKSFKDPETSPLPDRHRATFEGLVFFTPDTSYITQARLVRTLEAIPFMMPTNTDRKAEEIVYGIAHFNLKGKQYQLEVYKSTDAEEEASYLFLPFTDLTNGKETYIGGRYIDLTIPDGDLLLIDFNRAYNPYCAYNKKYSCPKVPKINSFPIKITAGVKDFAEN